MIKLPTVIFQMVGRIKLWIATLLFLLITAMSWEQSYNEVKVNRIAEMRVYTKTCSAPTDDYVRHWCNINALYYVFPEWVVVVWHAFVRFCTVLYLFLFFQRNFPTTINAFS